MITDVDSNESRNRSIDNERRVMRVRGALAHDGIIRYSAIIMRASSAGFIYDLGEMDARTSSRSSIVAADEPFRIIL